MSHSTCAEVLSPLWAYSFRGLLHYHQVEHGGMQVDVVLEKELRVLYLESQATDILTPRPYLLLQSHTS